MMPETHADARPRRSKRHSVRDWVSTEPGAWSIALFPSLAAWAAAGPTWALTWLVALWALCYCVQFTAARWCKSRFRRRYLTPMVTYALILAAAGVPFLVLHPGILWWAPIYVALCGVSLIYTEVQKRLVFAKYERLFGQGDFEGCVRLLARPLVRFSFPRYNLLYMRLNAQMCLADADASRAIIDEMLGLRTNDQQRLVLLLRAFNFFIEQEDYPRAKELLEELRQKAEPAQLKA